MQNIPRKTRKHLNFIVGMLFVICLDIAVIMALGAVLDGGDAASMLERHQRSLSFALLVANLWLWQFVYVLPIAWCFVVSRRKEVAKGIIAGGAVMSLINIGGCFMLFSGGFPPFIFAVIGVVVFGSYSLISSLLKK